MSKDTQNAFPAMIRKTPGVIGGDACIGNRRIAVWMLVEAKQLGMSDDEIRNRYEQPLSEAELSAAWDYYRQNHNEIERAIWQNQACMFEQKQDGPPLHTEGWQRSLRGTIPLAFLDKGRLLGLSDQEIRDAFEPPLKPGDLAAAWQACSQQHADRKSDLAKQA